MIKIAPPDAGAVEVPASELKALREEFGRRWWRQLAISGQVLLFAFPAMIALDEASPSGTPTWALVAVVVSLGIGLFGSFWNWRCPSCNSYFGKRFLGIKFCGSCGVPLVES